MGMLKQGQVLRGVFSQLDYRVRDLIGEGGQGEVYRIEAGGSLYALKWYNAQVLRVDRGLYGRLKVVIDRGAPSGKFLWPFELVTLPDGEMLLLAPAECQANPHTVAVIDRFIAQDNPIGSVRYVDVRQSMQNGGGPACLRLRIVMTETQRKAIKSRVFLDDSLYAELCSWVDRHYREQLCIGDLADVHLLNESRAALAELAGILEL